MVIVAGNRHGVQILNEDDCISHPLGKGMYLTILSPAMGKIVGQTDLFKLGMATARGEGKLNSNHFKTLKNWPYVTSCSCEGVGDYIYIYIYIYTN